MKSTAKTIPLCVDLDGTLILTDGFFEAIIRLLKAKPWYLLMVPLWLLAGRAGIKQKVAQLVTLDAASLPYRRKLVTFLEAEHKKDRTLVLATAANEKFARGVAEYLGVFSKIVASDGKCNLKGRQKAAVLSQLYGQRGFDYVGNSRDDIPVWAEAQQALAVGVSPGMLRQIARSVPVEPMFGTKSAGQINAARLLRAHHWVKNILVFSPLLLSHQVQDMTAWWQSIVTFVAFSLTASAVYICNESVFKFQIENE